MQFKATNQEMKTIIANAYNASRPMGLGFLHVTPEDFAPADILDETISRNFISLDYVRGRMVKLSMQRVPGVDNTWEILGGEPRCDYQSWASKFSSYRALVESGGAVVIG